MNPKSYFSEVVQQFRSKPEISEYLLRYLMTSENSVCHLNVKGQFPKREIKCIQNYHSLKVKEKSSQSELFIIILKISIDAPTVYNCSEVKKSENPFMKLRHFTQITGASEVS